MEYVPGGDLLSLMIRNGAFDEDLSRFYLAEITLALNTLHAMGYVHRDIKPENILLDRFGHLKLADFGNAAHLNKDGTVVSMSPVGTPDYIAPELLQTLSTANVTKSVHGVSCDYWSMGIIGYEFITETTPFHDDNVHETYSKIMAHTEDAAATTLKLSYPLGIVVSKEYRHLLDNLVCEPEKRLRYEQIVRHPYFKDTDWLNLRQRVPPIIPTLSGEDDTSNFEDVDKKARRSTFTKTQARGFTNRNEFSGQNLPFIGYSYVHATAAPVSDCTSSSNGRSTESLVDHSHEKLDEMQRTIDEHVADIKALQRNLLDAQRRNIQTESLEKILLEAKSELDAMKDRLKEKTVELAACRTDIKTLRSSLKIEEEMRLKSDENISQVLNQTYQKWEKAKKLAEQNYEKQIAEKKTEITSLTQTLLVRENELTAKVDECHHLQERVENYKEMLRSAKEQNGADKAEFEANKKQLIDAYETKTAELRARLKQEKETRHQHAEELLKQRQDADANAQSVRNLAAEKLTAQRNVDDMKTRWTRQIDENKELRQNAANDERKYHELIQKHDESAREIDRLQKELVAQTVTSRRSSICNSEVFRSAVGSMENLQTASSTFEEQLRNDLLAAKENENVQRERADRLETVVTRLEEAIGRFTAKPAVDDLLERQNEKLEDKLTAIREQAIVDRQASKAAHLSLWKLEKHVDDLNAEQKRSQRRLELADEKFRCLRDEKDQLERTHLDNLNGIQLREDRIESLQTELRQLRNDLKKEHAMWESAELERIKEKSEIVEHVSEIHRLESRVDEQRRKLNTIERRNDELVMDNKRLTQAKADAVAVMNQARDTMADLTDQLHGVQQNYAMLKEACTIMEDQLTELEQMYKKEMQHNRDACEKNDHLWSSVREKDETIHGLRHELNAMCSLKIDAETKCAQLQSDLQQITENCDEMQRQAIDQQQRLIDKTSALYAVQEKVEVQASDIANLQRINENFERELTILKEENARILTDLFLAKEDANTLTMELRDSRKEVVELKRDIDQLNSTMAEQKTYFVQRDIKSEATVQQYKKLISYLQQRVEELSQKKKKTFGLFGSNSTPKKENIPPVVAAANVEVLKKMEEDLRRERARCVQLTEQLLKTKTELRTTTSGDNTASEPLTENVQELKAAETTLRKSTLKRRSYQTHRFEMTLDNKDATTHFVLCAVCQKQVMINHSYWKCKECSAAVHRRCRSDVKTSCGGEETIGDELSSAAQQPSAPPAESPMPQTTATYTGDTVLTMTDYKTLTSLQVACILEIDDNTLLLAANSGLYSFHRHTDSIVHIAGIDNVKFIAADVTNQQSKVILIGDGGENLYQCDLRHLQNRAQAGECLKPRLDTVMLELPFANRLSSERWHYAAIHCRTPDIFNDALCIACTTCRIVVLRFDMQQGRFKPICALDTAMPVSSILFTRHSAIVCADKYFEIDLNSLAAEEFLNESDPSIVCTRNCRPMAVVQINQQEFLLCFEEFGVFVDEYGSRSRPDDLNWANPPLEFRYRDPLLFVGYRNMVQVMRVNKSYTNERARQQMEMDGDTTATDDCRVMMVFNEPRMMGDCGRLGIFLAVDATIVCVDGVQALKSHLSLSMETLFSSMASIPKRLRSDTMSTVDDQSSSS